MATLRNLKFLGVRLKKLGSLCKFIVFNFAILKSIENYRIKNSKTNMKNKAAFLKTKILLLCIIALMPFLHTAQALGNDPVSDGLTAVHDNAFQNQQAPGSASGTVVSVIGLIIKLALFVAGALAVLFVVIGGVLYLTAGGNDEQATKAKKTITNALIGIVIIILSYVLVNVVINLVNCGFSNGGTIVGGC